MTIEQFGSIGEVIGALATVATLVYLAVQIRQNTRTVRAASAASHYTAMNAVASIIATDPEVARIYYRGLSEPESLSDEERARFVSILGMMITYLQQAEELEGADALSRDMAHQRDAQLNWIVTQPGFRLVFALWGDGLVPRFRRRVEEAVRLCDQAGRLGTQKLGPGASAVTRSIVAADQEGAAADVAQRASIDL